MDADFVIVGSSPNALACAAKLAKGGARVTVLETRETVGGPVATEAFAPGFRADKGVTSVALDAEVAEAIGVKLDVVRRDRITALGKTPKTLREMPKLPEAFGQAVELVRAIERMDPPDVPVPAGDGAAKLDAIADRLSGFGARGMHEVLRLSFMSLRDFAEESVADEAVRALLAGVAVRGLSEGPFAPGTLFSLLHHEAQGDGLFRVSTKGGLGALSSALADAAREAGVTIRTGVAGPLRIELVDGAARGVHLGDGSVAAADYVVSDLDVRTTFTTLVSPRELDPETNRAVRTLRYRGSVARVHLALNGLPAVEGVEADALRGTLVAAGSLADIERAWDQGKRGVASSKPYVEFTVPTLQDPSLAPDGHHVLDAWVQYVPYGKGDGKAVLEAVLDQLASFAPGLREQVVHHHVSLPEDLEKRFGLTEGHLFGGEIRLDQAFFLRPLPGFSAWRTPIANLSLSGSAAHPGGYTGLSGMRLAAKLLEGHR